MGSPKEAALYFEKVFPIDFGFPALGAVIDRKGKDHSFRKLLDLEIPFPLTGFDNPVLNNLLPEGRASLNAYVDLFALSFCFWSLPLMSYYQSRGEVADFEIEGGLRSYFERARIDYDKAIEEASRTNTFNLGEFVGNNIGRFEETLAGAGLSEAPTWRGNFDFMDRYLSTDQERGDSSADYAVALSDLELIDASKVSWEAILEFRKDPKAVAALRDFRVFFSENFVGKDASFVSDKLNSLLDAYEATARFWGFETARKSLAIAVTQQGVATSAIGALATSLAGAPIGVAAAAGAVITLGNCALEFGQILVDSKKSELTRPLRYLSKLKSLSSE